MATIKQGEDLMLFIKKGDNFEAIACATNHTLSISTETSDTSHKDITGSWKASAVKSLSWEVSTENLFSIDGTGQAYKDLFTAMSDKTELEIVVGMATNTENNGVVSHAPAATNCYTGKVIITSLSLNMPNGDNATYSATFTGVGKLSVKTA